MLTDEDINRIIAFHTDGTVPQLARSGIYRFKKHAAKYELRNGELYVPGTNRVVVRPARAMQLIEEAYKRTTMGRDKIFDDLRREYANISIRMINDYLQKNPSHQLHKHVAVNNPITQPTVTKAPNQIWQMDVTEYKVSDKESVYLITIIDCFSKFAWVKSHIKHNNKAITSAETAAFMRTVMTPANHPKILKTDNGVEFEGEFKQFVEEFFQANGAPKHIRGGVYVKQSQAQIERFNQNIKQRIARYMTINSGPRLKINSRVVDWCVLQYNEALHATTKRRPFSLHDKNARDPSAISAAKEIRKLADKSIKQTAREFPQISVGDNVRVSIYALNPRLMADRRHGFTKGYVQQWSKEVYSVVKKYAGKYTVRANDGNEITTVRNQIQLIKE
jgi:transposase InsO family protein